MSFRVILIIEIGTVPYYIIVANKNTLLNIIYNMNKFNFKQFLYHKFIN